MREIIVIESNQSKQVRKLLNQAHINYKIYQEPSSYDKTTKKREEFYQKLTADYQSVAKSKKIQKEAGI
jgi:hypothetical protein